MNKEDWFNYLEKIAEKLNSYPDCAEIFEGIGEITFLYKVTDKPEFTFNQEYTGSKMIIHQGEIENATVTHIMEFDTIKGVFAGTTNPIEETAKGNYAVEGNTAKLLKAAGLLPYIKKAHSEIS